jgi:hypothetical protein
LNPGPGTTSTLTLTQGPLLGGLTSKGAIVFDAIGNNAKVNIDQATFQVESLQPVALQLQSSLDDECIVDTSEDAPDYDDIANIDHATSLGARSGCCPSFAPLKIGPQQSSLASCRH